MDAEGVGITIPARAELPESGPPTPTGRAFILRELANSLAEGTLEQVSSSGAYISEQSENLKPELMSLLEASIGTDQQRWAEVATSVRGNTRSTIGEILSSQEWRDINWNPASDHGFSIAKAALQKLPGSPKSDRLLVDTLFAESPF
jgi:hypothetical protein